MQTISSLYKSYERIKNRRIFLNDLLVNLRNDIKDESIKLYRAQGLNFYGEIIKLEQMRKFLLEYPNYLKSFKQIGLKRVLKNALTTIGITLAITVGIVLLIVLKTGFSPEVIWISIIVSSGFVFYSYFIDPVIEGIKHRKYILEKYENIENLDLEIEKTKNKQIEIKQSIVDMRESLIIKRAREKGLSECYEKLEALEADAYLKLQNAFDNIWEELARDYIYEEDLVDINLLKLTK